jgi:hypothetical protein
MTTPDGADSDIRSGKTMIDIVDALDLLNGCVQERGESWLPARDESSPSASLRYEAGRPVMDGMVSRALANAGTPPTPCRWLIHSSVVDAYAVGQNPFNLTLGAVVVLRAAESSERSGVAHFRLCLIDPRDIGECDTVSRGLIPACARAAERTEHVLNVPARRDRAGGGDLRDSVARDGKADPRSVRGSELGGAEWRAVAD